ncbi:hypothetical protein [Flavobacterium orientale]|uniref:Uncharacterized protein n=1 Tax=Flavobacterium orientale TaxID=1756020 RepID=A0A916Y512_9FLAO|nr:hypothetical protein [Flavobacterium orientale]GGD31484.1 hypothetical protein GCM10011343_22060 [Flavobacterium orientale]
MKSTEEIEKSLVTLSLIFYLVSLFLPAIYVFVPSFGKSISYDGWYALFVGSLSATMNVKQALIWLVNPIYLLALFSMKFRPKIALFFSLFVLITSLTFLGFENIQYTWSGRVMFINSLGFGYWFWSISFVLLLVAAFMNLTGDKNQYIT